MREICTSGSVGGPVGQLAGSTRFSSGILRGGLGGAELNRGGSPGNISAWQHFLKGDFDPCSRRASSSSDRWPSCSPP